MLFGHLAQVGCERLHPEADCVLRHVSPMLVVSQVLLCMTTAFRGRVQEGQGIHVYSGTSIDSIVDVLSSNPASRPVSEGVQLVLLILLPPQCE